ncbi:hypothetical protein OQJ18_09695 [Fluoribacter dumoffii]|uniref:hypothetical protein n=1 Tax=Fluoribacter dumoffii TaxID=463 RepID=UPI0022434CF4|nr:hypothetical protein [Fluoribacter dumoffii]MCW8417630.1 hypothetical protein [Fluoribacter dumoffii]MCW8454528.1 hypothetical protein [Fluoribacter dumoffii]MCW8461398.1 hypothetical protein [Fluoribacter dumoffii]MCW8484837.1 hypothetical protein [Fluoribacter dumoffii]
MSYQKIDQSFVDGFNEVFISHLSNPDIESENAAQKMLNQATADNYAKISRIFDRLSLPCVSREDFKTRMTEAGSIEAYMKPIIDEISKSLLTPDKSRINDEIIKAIGVEQYCRLVNGTNIAKEEDKIQIVPHSTEHASTEATELAEKELKQAEKLFAENFLQAILACYSGCFNENNKVPENKTQKELFEQMGLLKDAIMREEQIKGIFPTGWQEPGRVPENLTLKEFDEQAKLMIEKIQGAIKHPQKEQLWELLKDCQALYSRGESLLKDSNNELIALTEPMQKLGIRAGQTRGLIFNLKKPKEFTPETLKEKVELLLQVLEHSESKLDNESIILAPIKNLKEHLGNIKTQIDLYSKEFAFQIENNLPIPGFDDKVLGEYNTAIKEFMSAVNKEEVKKAIKPYELGIVKLILNKLSGGLFFASAKNYADSCRNMKTELLEMKDEFDQQPQNEGGLQLNQ